MMALQLKNGDATYYQSAEYCRNYTSPPVSYGDSSHYLTRLPGKELRLTISLMRQGWGNLARDVCRLYSGRWMLKPGCPGAAAIIIMSHKGTAPFFAAYGAWMVQCKITGCQYWKALCLMLQGGLS